MRKLLASLIASSMLLPTGVLASSIRPGSHGTLKPRAPKSPLCLDETEKFTEKCDIVIDETGVKGPKGHITNVVKWKTSEESINWGGAVIGGAIGTAGGAGLGIASCMLVGPFCLITAPAIMQTGAGVGAGAGGKGQGRFFTVIGDTADGTRVIQEFYFTSGKAVRKGMKALLMTTKLAEDELRD